MTEEDPVIPDELKDELESIPAEDPFVTEYMTQGGGNAGESLRFIEKWFPDEEDWQGKTKIQSHQASALAILRNLDEAFMDGEFNEVMPFLIGAIDDYEKYLTSIEGESRKEHVDILRTLFGGPQTDETESRSALMSAFAANINPQEDE